MHCKRKEFARRLIYGYQPDRPSQDNKAANYIPKTKIIEKRNYKGLLELMNTMGKESIIKYIVSKYTIA